MVLKLETNEKYPDKPSLNLKEAAPGDSFEFTLNFDEPRKGVKQGQWGEYTWRVFNVLLHKIGDTVVEKEVSFFASGRSPVFGKDFGEVLETYKRGSRLHASFEVKKGKRGFIGIWSVVECNAQTQSTPVIAQPASTTSSQPQPPRAETPQQTVENIRPKLIETLVAHSVHPMTGEKFVAGYDDVKFQCNKIGISNSETVDSIYEEYLEKMK